MYLDSYCSLVLCTRLKSIHAAPSISPPVSPFDRLAMADMGYSLDHTSHHRNRPVLCRDAYVHLVSGVAVAGTRTICDLLFLRRELVWPTHPDRSDMGHVPAHGVRYPAPFHGYGSGVWLCHFTTFGRRNVYFFDCPYGDVMDLHLDPVT